MKSVERRIGACEDVLGMRESGECQCKNPLRIVCDDPRYGMRWPHDDEVYCKICGGERVVLNIRYESKEPGA